MQMNLKTVVTAFPKISPSILNNYVAEAPTDGKTYARKDGQWVDIISNSIILRYGITPFNVLVDNTHNSIKGDELTPNAAAEITSLEGPFIQSITQKNIDISVKTPACGGYCWICSSMPLNSIMDKATGWVPDYFKQKDNITEVNSDGTTTTYYCYCLKEELIGNETFSFTLDVQGDKF